MREERAMKVISSELCKRVVEFHGHLGPFLVLGLRAGLLANSMLGKDCFKMSAVVATDPNPPYSCLIDGVQFVTGCTMGKGNIKFRKSKNTYMLFLKGEKKLKLDLKPDVLNSIRNASSEKDSENLALKLLTKSVDELFVVGK
jgi:formylmethanofuran dehydrogenase subunit E